MTTFLVTLALVVSCAAPYHPTPNLSASVEGSSKMAFFVGDSKTQKMLADVKLVLVSDGTSIFELGKTDLSGRVAVPLSKLRDSSSRVLLFCHDSYFCGALRIDEPSFFEYREHFIQLAPYALR